MIPVYSFQRWGSLHGLHHPAGYSALSTSPTKQRRHEEVARVSNKEVLEHCKLFRSCGGVDDVYAVDGGRLVTDVQLRADGIAATALILALCQRDAQIITALAPLTPLSKGDWIVST
ncbi:unnamed protein product [Pylaiella littoralis]